MSVFGNVADWWDTQHQQSEQILNNFVTDNPNMGAILLATGASTAMQLGSGLVDVLRLGQGVAQGGVRGYFSDALRLLTLLGPAFRGARIISARLSELRFLSPLSADLGVCSWVASSQAMRMTGRLFMSVDDLLRFNGFPNLRFLHSLRNNSVALRQIGAGEGTFLREIIHGMGILGARVLKLQNPTTMSAVEAATAANRNGVVLFNVHWAAGGHTLIAFRNLAGQFRILNRSGHVVSSLAELENVHPVFSGIGSSGVVYDEMYFVANTIVTQVTSGISTIAMEVTSVRRQSH
jgi:hypothetical protein